MKFLIFLCAFNLFASDFKGTYDLEVEIGGQIFHDVLVIDKVHYHMPKIPEYSYHSLEGTFEVPGVFKVPIKGTFGGGKLLMADLTEKYYSELLMSFTAIEGGQEFDVQLHSSNFSKIFFTGTLSSDGQVFGKFKGHKRLHHD